MNFSENISTKLMELITHELSYDEDKKEIIAYAIENFILFCIGVFFLILLGWSVNALIPTVLAAIFGGSLRRLSGGAHFNSPLKCLTFGSLAFTCLGVLANKIVFYDLSNKKALVLCLLLSLIIVVILAPVDSDAKPIHSSSLKFKLRMGSIFFIIITSLFLYFVENELVIVSVVLGVLYQSLTLLPIFNKRGGE